MLVGNKSDRVTEREVSTQEGHALARDLGCEFVEASAKNCVNVERAFYDVVRILRRQRQISAKRTQGPGTNDGNEPQSGRPGGKGRRGTRTGRRPLCIILWTPHLVTDWCSFSSLYFLWFEMSFCKHFMNPEQSPFSHSTPLDFLLQMGGYLISYDFSFSFLNPFYTLFISQSFIFFFFSFHSHTVLIETYCHGLRLPGVFSLYSLFGVEIGSTFYYFV